MSLLPGKCLATEVKALSKPGQRSLLFGRFHLRVHYPLKPRGNQLLECNPTLRCVDLGPVKQIFGEIDRGFHQE
jgi:hypothetical protein